jgi:hypothetical protein
MTLSGDMESRVFIHDDQTTDKESDMKKLSNKARQPRKLVIRSEAIAVLGSAQLEQVAGGASARCPSITLRFPCPTPD